ncbi:hypothetical protein TNCV_4064671 [Trichonephila clavipes]|nr:hypothetical protein TNCV_4064671 [Trichonephila clavipes]
MLALQLIRPLIMIPGLGKMTPNRKEIARQIMTPGVGYSMSRLQRVWLKKFPWPPSDLHTTITGTDAEPAFIRKKKNRYPHLPPMSLTLLAFQMTMSYFKRIARELVTEEDLDLLLNQQDHAITSTPEDLPVISLKNNNAASKYLPAPELLQLQRSVST